MLLSWWSTCFAIAEWHQQQRLANSNAKVIFPPNCSRLKINNYKEVSFQFFSGQASPQLWLWQLNIGGNSKVNISWQSTQPPFHSPHSATNLLLGRSHFYFFCQLLLPPAATFPLLSNLLISCLPSLLLISPHWSPTAPPAAQTAELCRQAGTHCHPLPSSCPTLPPQFSPALPSLFLPSPTSSLSPPQISPQTVAVAATTVPSPRSLWWWPASQSTTSAHHPHLHPSHSRPLTPPPIE